MALKLKNKKSVEKVAEKTATKKGKEKKVAGKAKAKKSKAEKTESRFASEKYSSRADLVARMLLQKGTKLTAEEVNKEIHKEFPDFKDVSWKSRLGKFASGLMPKRSDLTADQQKKIVATAKKILE